jgi:hypothetical protein
VKLVTFEHLKYLSFAHSGVYLTLLVLAVTEQPAKTIFGWLHGVGWIVISLLCVYAVRRRILPLWLGLTVAVIGGLGPFAGSIGFVYEERRRRKQEPRLERGMV